MYGVVNSNTLLCSWNEMTYFDNGLDNAITLLNNGYVVEVHRSGSNRLWYDLGKINLEKGVVEWKLNKKLSGKIIFIFSFFLFFLFFLFFIFFQKTF